MFFIFINDPYIAIIGDIKESKKLVDRKGVQEKLKEVLDEINETYIDDISSKFMITLGDEFQGLLGKGANVMNIISDVERKMYPIKIRFGVGVGEITTDINFDMAIGADGPGYYKARSAIEYIKQSEQRSKIHTSDIRIEVEGENESSTILINTILSLIKVMKDMWTDRQREIIWDMMTHQDGQIKAAKRLNITQSTVQKSLSNGNYYAYKESVEIVAKTLDEIRRNDV